MLVSLVFTPQLLPTYKHHRFTVTLESLQQLPDDFDKYYNMVLFLII